MSQKLKGECDCCPKVDVALTGPFKGMMMCEDCARDNQVAFDTSKAAAEVIETSHEIDATIELKSDIFNASTKAFMELYAAIQNDDTIPADKKEYALVAEADRRIKQMKKVIIEQDIAHMNAQMTRKGEHQAWIRQNNDMMSRLHAADRAKFTANDVNYQSPSITKKEKSTKPSQGGKAAPKRSEVNEAAAKYNVSAVQITMMVTMRAGLTPEAAARELDENRKRKLAQAK